MLRKSHLFRKSLCLFLVLALLLSAGCGSDSEGTASSETESETTDSKTDTEPIEDKFVMLREVYELLSGPLGEPYRTPEYWGGEEIDMMRVGDGYDDYLIALRNVQNEMHYLLYERDSDSITEIDTQGKHIPWDRIYEDSIDQELSFHYFITDASTQMVRGGVLTYSLSDHSMQDSGLGDPSLPRPEERFEIPSPVLNEEKKTYSFDFLSDLLEKLPEIYFTDQLGWYSFEQENISILNCGHYTLICLDGNVIKYYYVYQKTGTVSTIASLDAPNSFWDLVRFQQDEDYLVFPSPTGQVLPYIYYSFADFPYITLLMPDSPTNPRTRQLPLWDQGKEQHYLLGVNYCGTEWEAYHLWQSEYEFSIEWDRSVPNICQGDYCCPEIRVKTSPDRSVTVWVKKGSLSEEASQQLQNMQVEGIDEIRLSSAALQEIEPLAEGKTKEDLMEEGCCLSFSLEEGYQLYGEFSCTDNWEHPEAFLSFRTVKE